MKNVPSLSTFIFCTKYLCSHFINIITIKPDFFHKITVNSSATYLIIINIIIQPIIYIFRNITINSVTYLINIIIIQPMILFL